MPGAVTLSAASGASLPQSPTSASAGMDTSTCAAALHRGWAGRRVDGTLCERRATAPPPSAHTPPPHQCELALLALRHEAAGIVLDDHPFPVIQDSCAKPDDQDGGTVAVSKPEIHGSR